MPGPNGSTLHDTLPPTGCPSPFLCEGLQAVAADMGLIREQMARIEANQEMTIHEVRRLLVDRGLKVSSASQPSTPPDTVEVKGPKDWRFRGPAWPAVIIALAASAAVIVWHLAGLIP